MDRRDLIRGLIIGGGVGLLIQPILANNLSVHGLTYLTPVVRLGIFLAFLILAPLALWIAKLLSRWIPALYQFAQFAAVGTLNSFIDVGVFNLETFFYGSSFISNGLFATFKAISFLFGTTNSFIWNKYWTFGAKEKTNAKEVSGFYGVAIVGWVFNVGAATFVKSIGPVGSRTWVNIVAPLAGIAVSFIWNFIGYKYWVFKKKNIVSKI
jgi:putative flippase GtrA